MRAGGYAVLESERVLIRACVKTVAQSVISAQAMSVWASTVSPYCRHS